MTETLAQKDERIQRRHNNKLSRKIARQAVTPQADGTEVLHSKEARQKIRRWTFEADMVLTLPAPKDADGSPKLDEKTGEPLQEMTLPMRTMRLEAVSYCTAKEVRHDVTRHEAYLRASAPMFQTARIQVRAVPHETISNNTLRQLEGYRDMAAILDKALGIAIDEAADVVVGKSVGSQFVEKPAVLADGDKPAVKAVSKVDIKEDFYRRALNELKPKENSNDEPTGTPQQASAQIADSEEKHDFVPEIVEIERASKTSDTEVSAEL